MSEIVFKLELEGPVCIPELSEDSIRELVNALRLKVIDDALEGFVTASRASRVRFTNDGNGNFAGVTETVNGKIVTIIKGLGGHEIGLFEGVPSASHPGPGWEVIPELSKQLFVQNDDQTTWNYFAAKRVGVLNTFP